MRSAILSTAALFSRKEIWTAIGGYDEDMRVGFEDWDFWTRATRAGYTVTVVREILFYYRKHSVSMFADAQRKRSEIIEYMHRKYSPSGRLIDVVYVPLTRKPDRRPGAALLSPVTREILAEDIAMYTP